MFLTLSWIFHYQKLFWKESTKTHKKSNNPNLLNFSLKKQQKHSKWVLRSTASIHAFAQECPAVPATHTRQSHAWRHGMTWGRALFVRGVVAHLALPQCGPAQRLHHRVPYCLVASHAHRAIRYGNWSEMKRLSQTIHISSRFTQAVNFLFQPPVAVRCPEYIPNTVAIPCCRPNRCKPCPCYCCSEPAVCCHKRCSFPGTPVCCGCCGPCMPVW